MIVWIFPYLPSIETRSKKKKNLNKTQSVQRKEKWNETPLFSHLIFFRTINALADWPTNHLNTQIAGSRGWCESHTYFLEYVDYRYTVDAPSARDRFRAHARSIKNERTYHFGLVGGPFFLGRWIESKWWRMESAWMKTKCAGLMVDNQKIFVIVFAMRMTEINLIFFGHDSPPSPKQFVFNEFKWINYYYSLNAHNKYS